jgi:CHAT domain-containing protein
LSPRQNIYVKLNDELGWKRNLIAQVKAMQELGYYEQACQALIPVMGLENQGKFIIPNQNCEYLTNSNKSDKVKDEVKEPKAKEPLQLEQLKSVNYNLSTIQLTGVRLLGDVLRKLGYLDKSLNLLQAVEPLISQQNSPEEKALIWLSLGNTYEALANRNKFLSDFQQKVLENYNLALDYYQKVSNITDISQIKIYAQLNLFSILVNEKTKNVNSKEVEDLHLEILSQLSKLPPSRQKVYAEVSLMKSLSSQLKNEELKDIPNESWQEIIELGEKAVKLAKDLDDGRATAYALGNLGKIYVQKKQWLEAQKFTDKALLLSQNVKLNLPDLAYQWQRQLGIILRDREDKNIDGAIAAYTAAFNTLQSVRNDLVPISRDGQFDFRDEIEPVYRELVDLLLREPNQPHLKQAREVIEALQVAELDNFFRDACVVVNKAEEIDRIADKYDPTAAVIHAIILPDRLAIILKLPGKDYLEYRATPVSEETVKKTLRELGKYLKISDGEPDVREISAKLYKWMIEPLEGLLKNNPVAVETLVFVLDRSLQQIPMAVLLDPKNEEFLLKKYAVALAPALQLIDAKSSWKDRGNQKLKLFAGGVDEAQEIEGKQWEKIKEVKTEIDAISKFVTTTSKPLLNENFTKENIQKQIASDNYPIVHIKTHGQFSSDPEQTFIVAYKSLLRSKDLDSLVKSGSENDRRIIELLVLSACETAKGDDRATLGLAGIAVRAGARSTLSTLWKADDQKTTQLMAKFYEILVSGKPGMTKAKALNIAQKALFDRDDKTPGYKEAPNIWSNYVLVGNWL